jgi:hypothetical protein
LLALSPGVWHPSVGAGSRKVLGKIKVGTINKVLLKLGIIPIKSFNRAL